MSHQNIISEPTKGASFACNLLGNFNDKACSVLYVGIPNSGHTSSFEVYQQGEIVTHFGEDVNEIGNVEIIYLVNDTPEGYKIFEEAYNLLMDPLRITEEKKETGVYTRMSASGSEVSETVTMARCVVNAVEMNFQDKKGITIKMTVHGLRTED